MLNPDTLNFFYHFGLLLNDARLNEELSVESDEKYFNVRIFGPIGLLADLLKCALNVGTYCPDVFVIALRITFKIDHAKIIES